ncbi:LysR family transcriptional regulator [Oxalobacteraceae bacterium R-40]|uniref:LysR family transcriptional regulator n=1 Tax=Keguizhuia sedimenti TaxID=3064264 RepID=A0ABU1BS53_9BURK|nr:LysR family transcriptional regulator [Oxalobacteraceae bacterium R-40]
MEFDAIAVFVKVVQTGSFSEAARQLGMPKTTVSAKVAALEKRLGVSLIQRTTRKLYVTEAGEIYFRHCAIAMREVELGETALHTAKSTPTGLLRITVPVDIGHTVLPHITRAYLEKYPDMRVEIIVSNRIVDLVGEGIDLAIRAGALKDSSLIARRFMELDAGLWASPAYLAKAGTVAHPRDLVKFRVVAHRAMKTLHLSNGKTDLHVHLAGRVTADDLEAIRELVILGEGIAWLPDFLVHDAASSGKLVPVLPKWKSKSSGGFHFVHAGQKYALPKVRAFIETALETTGHSAHS